jgi:hypothetical protein
MHRFVDFKSFAERLKEKYRQQAGVHIWTKDRRLKAREPDPEPDPFV